MFSEGPRTAFLQISDKENALQDSFSVWKKHQVLPAADRKCAVFTQAVFSRWLTFPVPWYLWLTVFQCECCFSTFHPAKTLQLKYSLATELNLETDPHSVSFFYFLNQVFAFYSKSKPVLDKGKIIAHTFLFRRISPACHPQRSCDKAGAELPFIHTHLKISYCERMCWDWAQTDIVKSATEVQPLLWL